MAEKRLAPKAHAIALSKAWGNRFPVDVRQIALELSSRRADPIAKIVPVAVPLDAFEGALMRKGQGKKWAIVYSEFIREQGKINFTIAHELGHYELHRHTEGATLCSEDDLRDFALGSRDSQNIEQEANTFASYLLMPIGDYRQQVDGQAINVDLLAHCSERYGTSLTASALKLIEFSERPVVVAISKGGAVLWSRSSEAALRLGCFLRKGAPLPAGSLSVQCHEQGRNGNSAASVDLPPGTWFANAGARESAIAQPHYGAVFTILECVGISARRSFADDEEPEVDAFDHFRSFSREG